MQMHLDSSVLAIVPHYNVNQWLGQCIQSLLNQTRRPDAIIVVDDCSLSIPMEVLDEFPSVTLLKTKENGGPYRIIQAIIDQTDYEVIMFQDADDWSAPDRLYHQLLEAVKWNADMIGTQIEMIFEYNVNEPTLVLPADPFPFLIRNPLSHLLFYASSIISREFFLKLGGFSAQYRFGADSEFVRRAILGGRVRNVDKHLYYRRIHPGSLTHNHKTGFGTSARLEIQQEIQAAALSLLREIENGENLSLQPIAKGLPAELLYLGGPKPVWGIFE